MSMTERCTGGMGLPCGCSQCVPNYLRMTATEVLARQFPPESILQEAHRLTHGPRQVDYGHPLDDYTRTAALVSGLLAHKLKKPLTPDEMALVMVCVKLSRQINRPKRDNAVDGAGYFWVAQECLDELERRQPQPVSTTKES